MAAEQAEQIGKYEILSTLGRGAMGLVYKARDPEIGRLVAVKTLRELLNVEKHEEARALERFRQEARSAGRLQHPNIVTIYEAGKGDDGTPFIVMEYIDGVNLALMLRDQGRFSPEQVLEFLIPLANAIDYAHSQNVFHRDIKPSNVIIEGESRALLLDFGVARASDTALTPVGDVVGTPGYMSPEHIRGEGSRRSSDLFAFSVMTYELLTGKLPFPGKDFVTIVSNIIHKPPLSFQELEIRLPLSLQNVLLRALSKKSEDRFSSARDFVDNLAKIVDVNLESSSKDDISQIKEFTDRLKEGKQLNGSALENNEGAEQKTIDLDPHESDIFSLGGLSSGSQQAKLQPISMSPPEEIVQERGDYQEPLSSNLRDRGDISRADFPGFDDEVSQSKPKSALTRTQLIIIGLINVFIGLILALYLSNYDFSSLLENRVEMHGSKDKQVSQPVSDNLMDLRSKSADSSIADIKKRLTVPKDLTSLNSSQLNQLLIDTGIDDKKMPKLILEASSRKDRLFLSVYGNLAENGGLSVKISVLKALFAGELLVDEKGFDIASKLAEDDDYLVRGHAVKSLGKMLNTSVGDSALDPSERVLEDWQVRILDLFEGT